MSILDPINRIIPPLAQLQKSSRAVLVEYVMDLARKVVTYQEKENAEYKPTHYRKNIPFMECMLLGSVVLYHEPRISAVYTRTFDNKIVVYQKKFFMNEFEKITPPEVEE